MILIKNPLLKLCAEGGIRTRTPERALPPQDSVSTSSTTSANSVQLPEFSSSSTDAGGVEGAGRVAPGPVTDSLAASCMMLVPSSDERDANPIKTATTINEITNPVVSF